MKSIALFAIRAYQRYLSPVKGFNCAYRCHTGRGSCSALGYRAIRRYGVMGGLLVTQARFRRCAATPKDRTPLPTAKLAQMGFVDGCDGCGGCDLGGEACSVADACSVVDSCPVGGDCSDCSFNPWSRAGRQRRRDERRLFS